MARYVKNDFNYHGGKSKVSTSRNESRNRFEDGRESYQRNDYNRKYPSDAPGPSRGTTYDDAWGDGLKSEDGFNAGWNEVKGKGQSRKQQAFKRSEAKTHRMGSAENEVWGDVDDSHTTRYAASPPLVNVWEERKAKFEERNILEPKTETEEERMIREALEMSKLDAQRDEEKRRQLDEEYNLQVHLLETNPELFDEFRVIDDPFYVSGGVGNQSSDDRWSDNADQFSNYENNPRKYKEARPSQSEVEGSSKKDREIAEQPVRNKGKTKADDSWGNINASESWENTEELLPTNIPSKTFHPTANKSEANLSEDYKPKIKKVVKMFGGWGVKENSNTSNCNVPPLNPAYSQPLRSEEKIAYSDKCATDNWGGDSYKSSEEINEPYVPASLSSEAPSDKYNLPQANIDPSESSESEVPDEVEYTSEKNFAAESIINNTETCPQPNVPSQDKLEMYKSKEIITDVQEINEPVSTTNETLKINIPSEAPKMGAHSFEESKAEVPMPKTVSPSPEAKIIMNITSDYDVLVSKCETNTTTVFSNQNAETDDYSLFNVDSGNINTSSKQEDCAIDPPIAPPVMPSREPMCVPPHFAPVPTPGLMNIPMMQMNPMMHAMNPLMMQQMVMMSPYFLNQLQAANMLYYQQQAMMMANQGFSPLPQPCHNPEVGFIAPQQPNLGAFNINDPVPAPQMTQSPEFFIPPPKAASMPSDNSSDVYGLPFSNPAVPGDLIPGPTTDIAQPLSESRTEPLGWGTLDPPPSGKKSTWDESADGWGEDATVAKSMRAPSRNESKGQVPNRQPSSQPQVNRRRRP